MDTKNIYTIPEAAKYIGRTRQGIYQMVKTRKLSFLEINGKSKLLAKEDLDLYKKQ